MSNFIVNKSLDFIKNYSNFSNKDLDKIRYGIEGVYLTISKIILVILIGFLFSYLDVVILTLLFFNILRFFAFGLHAKKSWHCLVISIINFNIFPLVINNISINNIGLLFIGLISLISFILFAPSDTEKRPLKNRKKRIIRKLLSILSCILYLLIAFYFGYFKVPIICSLIIEVLMINPLSYKLLGLTYNNYKK